MTNGTNGETLPRQEPAAAGDKNSRPSSGTEWLRTYGRRKGRAGRRHATLLRETLPVHAVPLGRPPPEPLARLFPGASGIREMEIWLEIGFGGGEHLIGQAHSHPHAGLIGCEPYEDGVIKVLAAIESARLANIRVHAGDARLLLRWLPPACLDRVFILFPDPWPKKRHRKRRIVSPSVAALLAHTMKPGAELRLATDVGEYACQMLLILHKTGEFRWLAREARDWRERPADWPATRYEEKARAAGRRCIFLRFLRTP